MVILAGYTFEAQRETIRYGVRQIEQMCDDRPDMKDVLSADHKVVRWCAAQFGMGITVAESSGTMQSQP